MPWGLLGMPSTLVPLVRIFAIILFVMFAVALVVISSLLLRSVMTKTIRGPTINVKPATIIVVRAPADTIRSIIVLTSVHSAVHSVPEASYPSETKNPKDNHQHNKLLNHFYFPSYLILSVFPMTR